MAQGCTTSPLNEDTVSPKQPIKNVLFIALDDLRPELNSFGATHIHSPNIDALAENSRIFLNHFVNAPSCGPSRYSLLTGRYGPTSNNAMKGRAEALKKRTGEIPASMPAWFKSQGYTTIAVGKVSHYPGGNMGENWDDPSQPELPDGWSKSLMPVAEWETPKGAMHGLAHGEIRKKASDMDVFQAAEDDDNIYPDGLITDEAIQQLQQLTNQPEKPFFLAVGLIKPHLPFGAPKKYLDLYEGVAFPENPYPNKPKGPSTWFNSNEFMKYNRWGKNPLTDEAFAQSVRRHYAACVSYADAQVGKILQALKDSGADKNTVVVLWGDHGWNLGEHGMWGKHNLYEQALRSPLLISYPDMPNPGEGSQAVVETADIFPTLTKLIGLPMPEQPHGKSLIKQVNDPDAQGHAAYAYWRHNHTIRMGNFRLIHMGKKGFALYDLASQEKETKNVADQHPELVKKMMKAMSAKMQQRDKF
ncbi:sulfatase [Catenovulum adriaticum]|uniref:Sulfatase n=1 Tax=Catenovulum adriaticum TaxID=2984846 RepID=A0ABY7AQ69_9ALTE|nr:sulfatase [Catenovulum sp. TS8]WAJ71707.1 sulfatase [Catenovulum sp. TS8]